MTLHLSATPTAHPPPLLLFLFIQVQFLQRLHSFLALLLLPLLVLTARHSRPVFLVLLLPSAQEDPFVEKVRAELDVRMMPRVRLVPVISCAIAAAVLMERNVLVIAASETTARDVGLHPIVHEVCSAIMATVYASSTRISIVEMVF